MHRYFLSFAFLLTNPVFAQEQGYHIQGKFEGDYRGYVFMHYDGKVDSALVEDGRFTFQGTLSYVTEA